MTQTQMDIAFWLVICAAVFSDAIVEMLAALIEVLL